MTKTGCYLCAAIYACEGLILLVTTELKCFFNNRSEIILFIDMNSTREGNHFCCEHSVDVAAFWRHQTICGVENRSRNMIKFFLLILPCCSEISFQVREFL